MAGQLDGLRQKLNDSVHAYTCAHPIFAIVVQLQELLPELCARVAAEEDLSQAELLLRALGRIASLGAEAARALQSIAVDNGRGLKPEVRAHAVTQCFGARQGDLSQALETVFELLGCEMTQQDYAALMDASTSGARLNVNNPELAVVVQSLEQGKTLRARAHAALLLLTETTPASRQSLSEEQRRIIKKSVTNELRTIPASTSFAHLQFWLQVATLFLPANAIDTILKDRIKGAAEDSESQLFRNLLDWRRRVNG